MIIPVNVHNRVSETSSQRPPSLAQLGNNEYVLIELQGALEVEGDKQGGIVGKLNVDGEKPTFHIGHNLLEGKVVSLAKPLAILHRHRPTHSSNANGMNSVDYGIVAIVRRKLVFSKRPMPVVGAAGQSILRSEAMAQQEKKRLKLG